MTKKTLSRFFVCMLAFTAIILTSQMAYALDPLYVQDVKIDSCNPLSILGDTVSILLKDTVRFVMKSSPCDSVKIIGISPINTFVLKDTDTTKVITFQGQNAGNYTYKVYGFPGGDSLTGRLVKAAVPFLDTWGIVVLLMLLLGTAWFVLSRRKVRATGATA